MKRSLRIVLATLLLASAMLAAAQAFVVPWAVRAGWFTSRVEAELSALVGTPVRVRAMRLESSRRLVLDGVTIGDLSPAVKDLKVERVAVDFDRVFPWGAPTALEFVRPSVVILPEKWERGEGGEVELSRDLCAKLHRLPPVLLRSAEIEIRTEFDVEKLTSLDGRLARAGEELRLSARGRVGDGPPGSFVIDGSVDLGSGRPTMAARTVQPALPTPLRRLLASLLSVHLEDLQVRQDVTLDEGSARRLELSMEPRHMQAVIRAGGRPIEAFGLSMSLVETSVELTGSIPALRLPLGNGGVADLEAAFSLWRRSGDRYEGVARIRAEFYAKADDAEPIETADLLLEDLAIGSEPATLSFHGSVTLGDGREIELTGVQASEQSARVMGAIRGWDVRRQPWGLVPMEAPPVDGLVNAEFDATWANQALDARVAMQSAKIDVQEAIAFATDGPVIVHVQDKKWEAHAKFRDVLTASSPKLRPLAVVVDFTGTRDGTSFLGDLTARCEGTELRLEAAVEAAAPSVRGHGLLTAEDGPTLELSEFEFVRREEKWITHLQGGAKEWDLSRPWALAWEALGIERPDLRGVVDLTGDVWQRGEELSVDVGIASAGWAATFGGTEIRLGPGRAKWTPILAGLARKIEVELPGGLGVTVAGDPPLEAESGAVRLDGQFTHGIDENYYIFQSLVLTVAGGEALRGTERFDGRKDEVKLTLNGAYDFNNGSLTLAESTLAAGTWGRAAVTGGVAETFTKFVPRLRVTVSDCAVERLLEAASLGIDVKDLVARGTAGGEWEIDPDGGIGIVRASLSEVAFKNFRWTGVEAEIPFLYGKPGRAAGNLTYREFEYPGGRAGGSGADFVLGRDGTGRYEARMTGRIEGKFCDGVVTLDSLVLRGGGGSLTGEAALGASRVDVAVFSELVGLRKKIPGVLSGRFESARFSMDEIVFAGEGLRGDAFEGAWALREVRIEDPFGQMTSYAMTADFDRLNLRHLLAYWTDYGIVHGSVAGTMKLELFKSGDPTGFEMEIHDAAGANVEKQISKSAVANLIRAFNPTAEGETSARRLEDLDMVPEYDRVGVYARMDRDQRLTLRGRYYLDPATESWGTYSLSDLRANVARKGVVEYLMVGGGRHRIDVIQRTPLARPRFDGIVRRLKTVPVTGE